MQLPALADLLPVATGIALYWVFPGWLVRQELECATVPARNSPGSAPFLAGQAVTLVGVTALGGLLGLTLNPWVQQLHLAFALLLLLGLLLLAQAAWILLDMPLHDGHEPIVRLSFETGRDLMLRHSLPLFLAFALLVPMESAGVVRKELTGLFLGWAGTNVLWGVPFGRKAELLRRGLSLLCAVAGTYLLWKGWSVR